MDEMRDMLKKCVKCGQCRSICPVFGEVQREMAVPRGKMALLEVAMCRPGELLSDLAHSLSLCLLCGTCSATCPNGAEAHQVIRQARELLAQQYGMRFWKRSLSHFSGSHRIRRDRLLRPASALQKIVTTAISEDRGIRFRLPLDRLYDGWIPPLERPFFLDRPVEKRMRRTHGVNVGLFVGCAIHYIAPHVGDATLDILSGMGFRTIIPKQQGCCGLMAYGMGDTQTARRLARHTMQDFQDLDIEAIVAPCASCASHLKMTYPLLFGEDQHGAVAAREFSSKVWEFSTFLVHHGFGQGQSPPVEDEPRKVVTYHDPCHLARHMGIKAEPRKLLRSLHSAEYREMEGSELCCGMGGSFRLSHPQLSREIFRKKTEAIGGCGAQAVVTGCMGCWIQLQERLYAENSDAEVMHLAECLRGTV